MRICKFEGCGRKHYANGWCRTHYYQTHVHGHKASKINAWGTNYGECKIRGCHKQAETGGYCPMHYIRVRKFGKANILHKRGAKSQGGHEQYLHHTLMKRNRLIKLTQDPYCEICHANKATMIHHIDGTKTNHDIDNLMSICGRGFNKCHRQAHKMTRTKAPIRLSQDDVRRISTIVRPEEFTRKEVADMFRRDQLLAIEINRKKDI